MYSNTYQKNSGSKTVDHISHEVHRSLDGLRWCRFRRPLIGPLLLLMLRRRSISSLTAIIPRAAIAPGATMTSRWATVAPRASGTSVTARSTRASWATGTIMVSGISPGGPVVPRWGSKVWPPWWAAAVLTGWGPLEGRPNGTVGAVAERRRRGLEGSLLTVGVEGKLLGRSHAPVLPLRPLGRQEPASVLTRAERLRWRLVGRAVEVGRQRSVRRPIEEWRPAVLWRGSVERRPGLKVLQLAHVCQ